MTSLAGFERGIYYRSRIHVLSRHLHGVQKHACTDSPLVGLALQKSSYNCGVLPRTMAVSNAQ